MLLRRLALLVLSVCFFFVSHSANAADDASYEEKDEYDFSWLDPDKKIYVVQNRKYTKARKVEVALSGGVGLSEPYRQTKIVLPRFYYYINESFGLSVFAGFNSNKENNNSIVLKSEYNLNPVVRDVQSFYGGSFLWVPFYGKINMFNKILYLDWHFELGVNQLATEIDLNTNPINPAQIAESSHMGFHWGTGQKFFITRNWAARLDFLALYYKAPRSVKQTGASTATFSGGDDSHEKYFVTLGVSYTF